MKQMVTVIGLGEMGSVFARGFLKAGWPVYPVRRADNLNDCARDIGQIKAAVVAVSEKDLSAVLKSLPSAWQDRLILLQNELLPRDWEAQGLLNPTVISVWFEKKSGQDTRVIIPSPVYGPLAELLQSALAALKIPTRILSTLDELLFELVLKNLYILTVNISGLKLGTGATVNELWIQHQDLARALSGDVLDLQFKAAGKTFDREKLLAGMVQAFLGDPQHKCLGRTAPARLERAIQEADRLGLEAKTLRMISQQVPQTSP